MHDVHNRRNTRGASPGFVFLRTLATGAARREFFRGLVCQLLQRRRQSNRQSGLHPAAIGPPVMQVSVFQNGQKMNAGNGNLYFPHSTIIAQDGAITDTQFFNLLSSNLTSNGNWTQDSLDIHMAQCFSGGFIDELDLGNVQNVEINTASQWASPSVGTVGNKVYQYNVPNGNGYLRQLQAPTATTCIATPGTSCQQATTAPAGSVNTYSTTLIGGYLLGADERPRPRPGIAAEGFSRGTQYTSPQTGGLQSFNLADNDVIGAARCHEPADSKQRIRLGVRRQCLSTRRSPSMA